MVEHSHLTAAYCGGGGLDEYQAGPAHREDVTWLGRAVVVRALTGCALAGSRVTETTVDYRGAMMAWLQRRPEFCRILSVCLSGSVIAVATLLFLLAFVRGADVVAAMPRRLWWCMSLYAGMAIGICSWLLKAPANKGAPLRPRPRARQA